MIGTCNLTNPHLALKQHSFSARSFHLLNIQIQQDVSLDIYIYMLYSLQNKDSSTNSVAYNIIANVATGKSNTLVQGSMCIAYAPTKTLIIKRSWTFMLARALKPFKSFVFLYHPNLPRPGSLWHKFVLLSR